MYYHGALMFFIFVEYCWRASSVIIVHPQIASRSVGDSIELRCHYNETEVKWFYQIYPNNPIGIARDNACRIENPAIDGNHSIYREADDVCVLEAKNLSENITYWCWSTITDKKTKAYIVVIAKESKAQKSTTESSYKWKIVGIAAVVIFSILIVIVIITQCLHVKNKLCWRINNGTDENVPLSENYSGATYGAPSVLRDDAHPVEQTDVPSGKKTDEPKQPEISFDWRRELMFSKCTPSFLGELRVYIQVDYLIAILNDISNDAVEYIMKQGAHKFYQLADYIGRLPSETDSEIYCLTDLKCVKSGSKCVTCGLRGVKNLTKLNLKDTRTTQCNSFYEDLEQRRKNSLDEDIYYSECVDKSQIEDKYSDIKQIIKLQSQLSGDTLPVFLRLETEAWNTMHTNICKCPYHGNCYDLMKKERFELLLLRHWKKWLETLKLFKSERCMDGMDLPDIGADGYSANIEKKFKYAVDALEKCNSAASKNIGGVDVRLVSTAGKNVVPLARAHVVKPNSSQEETFDNETSDESSQGKNKYDVTDGNLHTGVLDSIDKSMKFTSKAEDSKNSGNETKPKVPLQPRDSLDSDSAATGTNEISNSLSNSTGVNNPAQESYDTVQPTRTPESSNESSELIQPNPKAAEVSVKATHVSPDSKASATAGKCENNKSDLSRSESELSLKSDIDGEKDSEETTDPANYSKQD